MWLPTDRGTRCPCKILNPGYKFVTGFPRSATAQRAGWRFRLVGFSIGRLDPQSPRSQGQALGGLAGLSVWSVVPPSPSDHRGSGVSPDLFSSKHERLHVIPHPQSS